MKSRLADTDIFRSTCRPNVVERLDRQKSLREAVFFVRLTLVAMAFFVSLLNSSCWDRPLSSSADMCPFECAETNGFLVQRPFRLLSPAFYHANVAWLCVVQELSASKRRIFLKNNAVTSRQLEPHTSLTALTRSPVKCFAWPIFLTEF